MNRRTILATVVFVGYTGTVYGANWALTTWPEGLPVWPGLVAPAGVYAAGLAFGFRDALQQLAGRWAAVAGIGVGSLLAWFLADPAFAIASVVAFGTAELLDMAVFTPLRDRRPYLAVVASNTVGLLADSVLFLWLAFGSMDFLLGQSVGKALMILPAVALMFGIRRWVGAR